MPTEIEINGADRSLDEGTTLAALFAVLDLDARGTAVVLNEQIIEASRYEDTVLQTGDRVEIVRMVGGG